jgi:TRAP-type C4-dicarboxylate transport system permease small subunit
MRHWLEKATTWWAVAGGVLLLLMILVTVINVGAFALDRLARLWGASVPGLPGYEDFVRLGISCAALMFLPYCQLKRGHVAVDLFVTRMPSAVRSTLDAGALMLLCALSLFLAYWMTLGMIETRGDGAVSRVLGWAEWPFYLPGIVSLLLWAAISALQVAGHADSG